MTAPKSGLPAPDVELLNSLIDVELNKGMPFEHGKIGARVAAELADLSSQGNESAARIAWAALCEWCAMRSHKRADALNVYYVRVHGKSHRAAALAGQRKRTASGRPTNASEAKLWRQMSFPEHGLWLESMRAKRDAIDVRVQAHQELQSRWSRECPQCLTAEDACAFLGLDPAILKVV